MPRADINQACRLHDRAVAARADGKYDQAEALGQRALAWLEKAAGPDHPDVANVLNHLAGIHVDRSDYAKAERLYRRAVRITEDAYARSPAFRRLGVRTTKGAVKLHRHGQSHARPPQGGTTNGGDPDPDLIRLRVQSLGDLASLSRRRNGCIAARYPSSKRPWARSMQRWLCARKTMRGCAPR